MLVASFKQPRISLLIRVEKTLSLVDKLVDNSLEDWG